MVHNYPKGLFEFYSRIYELVDDPSTDSMISWSKNNKSFIIWNPEELLQRKILSRFYCSTDFPRFLSELNCFGFKRIKKSAGKLEFGHDEYFVRGQPELLKKMQSKTSMKRMKKRLKARKTRLEVENRMQHLQI